jgi:hypothetical protein
MVERVRAERDTTDDTTAHSKNDLTATQID